MLDPVFGYLISFGAALLFASASIHKLRDITAFSQILDSHRVLPDGWAPRVAVLVPLVEAALAAGLLLPQSRRAAGAAGAATLLCYAASLRINLRRGRLDLECGCGPARTHRSIASWMIWRNLTVAAALAAASLPWQARDLTPMDIVTLIGGLAVTAALYAILDHLLGVVAPHGALLKGT